MIDAIATVRRLEIGRFVDVCCVSRAAQPGCDDRPYGHFRHFPGLPGR